MNTLIKISHSRHESIAFIETYSEKKIYSFSVLSSLSLVESRIKESKHAILRNEKWRLSDTESPIYHRCNEPNGFDVDNN